MTAMRVLVIRTDGREEVHEIARALAVVTINRLIGADTFDAVDLRDGRVMLVDDTGLIAGRPINPKATALYHMCRPGTTNPIAGDVAIAIDKDFA